MKTTKIQINSFEMLADFFTPVSLFLKLRDHFQEAILLESTDFHAGENSCSHLCFEPVSSFQLTDGEVMVSNENLKKKIGAGEDITSQMQSYFKSFQFKGKEKLTSYNGFFGYSTFDAVQYFEDINFNEEKKQMNIADINYSLYRFVITFDHYRDNLFVLENCPEGEPSRLKEFTKLLNGRAGAAYSFQREGEEKSNLTDDQFKELVVKGKYHCKQGDVFQVVFSRQFSQEFKGDAFNVYRSLRSLNPSPYLFFFDYGGYSIFGSSPEAQLVINDKKAQIHPIAGTYKRTGDDAFDQKEALRLSNDPKEAAEHVMLVDLARNDLSRNSDDVEVLRFKEVQYFSHVIHLVSIVEAKLREEAESVKVFGDTFPAGTLSGAPKYRALQLIDQYENQNRSFYGGAVGKFGLDGSINQAIMIRTFLTKNNHLFYQAGAGIVIKSEEENELQEVNNKLRALRAAMELAETLNN
nr:anthranilate synthase component I family protein [Xanthovirga aplysinae]